MTISILNRLKREDRGNATVELALATPILLTMALAGVDVALGFVHKLEVQQYAQVGADYVMSEMENVPLAAQVKLRVQEASGLDVGKITVTEWIECDGTKTALPACLNSGSTATKYMKISVQKDYTPLLNIKGYADYVKTFTHTGSVTLRTL
ncbi:TadE/TadG family type IV pilus assembly protein [Qipengyuania zhejiangensis]|uniref:TadE/TadG family type IV pilus assembly protein n=1 Tax=Qipengyuania zhejiangensis TaxID=3077782 RepID=UPI002D77663D|nr:TadE/TadG family type IV pilus assembly protein [Qipengyuania sp. Z2]